MVASGPPRTRHWQLASERRLTQLDIAKESQDTGAEGAKNKGRTGSLAKQAEAGPEGRWCACEGPPLCVSLQWNAAIYALAQRVTFLRR